MNKRVMSVVALAAMLAAPVQAACWTRDEAAAAGVRQLQSMLMVTALRCQAGGEGMMADYNQFVSANRTAIVAENERIRAHFIHAQGVLPGERAYDSFTTSMANGYGAGAGAPRSCRMAASLAHEASGMGGSREGLLMLVSRLGLEARLPEGRCEGPASLGVASAAPVQAPPYAPASPYAAVRYAAAEESASGAEERKPDAASEEMPPMEAYVEAAFAPPPSYGPAAGARAPAPMEMAYASAPAMIGPR